MHADESEMFLVDLETEFDGVLEEDDDNLDLEFQEMLALHEFSELFNFNKFAVVPQSDGIENEDVDEYYSVFDIGDIINLS